MTRETARREDETLIDYLMRLSAIVGECNVVETQLDGELVPYYNGGTEHSHSADVPSDWHTCLRCMTEQREWNAKCASRFPQMKGGR